MSDIHDALHDASPAASRGTDFAEIHRRATRRRRLRVAAAATTSVAAAVVAVAVFGHATGDRVQFAPADQGREETAADAADCDASAAAVRREALERGASDAEASRAQDEAYADCTQPDRPRQVDPEWAPCADHDNRRNRVPDKRPGQVAVFFSCQTDIGSGAVYATLRPTSASTVGGLDELDEAVSLYLDGPSAEERADGYSAGLAGLRSALRGVSEDDGVAVLDFSAALESVNGFGTSGFNRVVLDELRATVLQFGRIEGLRVTVEGDCERFTTLLGQDGCRTIRRENAQTPEDRRESHGTVALFFLHQDAPPEDRDTYVRIERRAADSSATAEEQLTVALRELVQGPTATEKQDHDVVSTFSGATAGIIRDVSVDRGVALVDFTDFRDVIPQVSTSSGGLAFMTALNATVFAVDGVDEVRYSIDGDCVAFDEFMQGGGDCYRYTEPPFPHSQTSSSSG